MKNILIFGITGQDGTYLADFMLKKGYNVFGYDPIFYIPTHQRTSAELSDDTKNQLSHRGQALRKLVEKLSKIK